jgi:hypothetical protein
METENDSLKKIAKRFFILLFFLIIIVTLTVIRRFSTEKRLENEYFAKINFSFTGRVNGGIEYRIGNKLNEEIQPAAGTKFNLFYLEPIKCTIDDYDERDTSLEFYCIIKKKRICIIESTERENIEVGDIIKFDGIIDSTYHYKIITRRKNKNYYNDTILYTQWKPTNIFKESNRKRVVIEILRKNTPF